MKRVIRAAAISLVLGLVAGNASAQAPSPADIKQAGLAFDKGKTFFKNSEYVEAAEQFEAADLAAPSPAALQLAIRSRDEGGQLDRAATLARLAKDRHPGNAKLVELADGILEKAAPKFHVLTVKCDAPCTLVVGVRVVHGKANIERVLYLQEGDAGVRASWSKDRVETQNVSLTTGGSSEISFTQPPEPVVEEPPVVPAPAGGGTDKPGGGDDGTIQADTSGGWSPAVVYVLGGLTVVAGGASVWSGFDTQNNPGKKKVEEACTVLAVSTPAGASKCQTLYDDGKAAEDRTNLLLIGTGVLGLASIVVGAFLTDWSGDEPAVASAPKGPRRYPSRARTPAHARSYLVGSAQKLSVQPWIGVGNGATLGASGRF